LIIEVPPEKRSERLDLFLAELYPKLSRSEIQRWITAGSVIANGKVAKKNLKLEHISKIEISEIPEKPASDLKPENIPLNILYEDDDLIILNKPRNLVVHPGNGVTDGTLAAGLLYHYKHLSVINGAERPGIIHRLDKDTPGLMIAARNDTSHIQLAQQLENRRITRIYHAVVWGHPEEESGTVSAPIGRSLKNRLKMSVQSKGRKARTHWRVLKYFKYASLLELSLDTGRTHQIRVHMDYIGFPVMGDPLYNGRDKGITMTEPLYKGPANNALSFCPAQMLQAMELKFKHPKDDRDLHFKCEYESSFKQLLEFLNKEDV
jgi:23S rRNA pseudouridine1911/1915/1917 synthase